MNPTRHRLGSTRFVPLLLALLAIPLVEREGSGQGKIFPLGERFRVVDSVILQSTLRDPIVRLSGLAMSSDGRFVVSDISEGTVRLYARDGKLESVLGAKGSGPGEFRAPVLPRFDKAGRVHVPDIGLQRVVVFALPQGPKPASVVRTTSLARSIRAIFGFALGPNEDYLISGAGENPKQALFLVDSLGALKDAFLEVRSYERGPAAEPGVWQALTVTSAAADGGLAFVTLSTFDSLWTVDLRTRSVKAVAVPYTGYRAPLAPNRPFVSREERRAWATSQMVSSVYAAGQHLFVPFFRGVYNEGIVSDVAYRNRTGPWEFYEGMPSILSIVGDTVLALRPAEARAVVLKILIRR